MLLRRPEVLVAIVGGVLFAVGLFGTVTSAASARLASEGFALDCIMGTPAPDCAQRAATIASYNALTALSEAVGIVGFGVIIAAVIVGVVLDRRRKNLAKAPPSRP